MKKSFLSLALVVTIASSLTLSSCIGSFTLTNKMLSWNNRIGNKFVNELVFVAFWILPVYEVSGLADILVLNSIEFWSGNNPVAKGTTKIKGNDGEYLVKCDGKGYTIKSLNDGSTVRLNFDVDTQSWSYVDNQGQDVVFLTYVDDTHVKVPAVGGDYQIVEISQQGVLAYQQSVLDTQLACR